jgi:hypothetical protein
MKYTSDGQSASRDPRFISGAGLAQRVRHLTPTERAVLAAEILSGDVVPHDLTAKTVAALCNVSVPYMLAAARTTVAERQRIKRGERPLMLPRPTTKALRPPPRQSWQLIDDATLADLVREIGVDRTFDAVVAAA